MTTAVALTAIKDRLSRPRRVLVVEDDPNDVEFLRAAFTESGLDAELEVSETPVEAEECLTRRRFDLILLDLALRLGSGLDVLAWMKQARLHCPVVVVTGSRGVNLLERAKEFTILMVLTKPVTPAILKELFTQLSI